MTKMQSPRDFDGTAKAHVRQFSGHSPVANLAARVNNRMADLAQSLLGEPNPSVVPVKAVPRPQREGAQTAETAIPGPKTGFGEYPGFRSTPDRPDPATAERRWAMCDRWLLWAIKQEGLPNATAKMLLVILAKHADEAGFCRPSIDRLGRLVCADARTVQRQLKALEEIGLIRREIGGGWMPESETGKQGRSSSYQLIAEPGNTAESDQNIPGNLSPKIKSSPAVCHPRKSMNTVVPRQFVTLTEVSKKVGGGSARSPRDFATEPARGSTPSAKPSAESAENGNRKPPPAHGIDPERLGELVEAIGWAQSGKRPTANDLAEARDWADQLGLSHADQLEVIHEALSTKPGLEPPGSFRYLSKAMARHAGKLARAPLEPLYPTENNGKRANEQSDKHRRFQRIIDAASEGASSKDWG